MNYAMIAMKANIIPVPIILEKYTVPIICLDYFNWLGNTHQVFFLLLIWLVVKHFREREREVWYFFVLILHTKSMNDFRFNNMLFNPI